MPAFVGPTCLTLLAWLVLAATFTGLGGLALRTIGSNALDDLFAAFWVGLATTLAWLQLWSLFGHVAWQALVLPLGAGAIGWLITSRIGTLGVLKTVLRPALVLGVVALAAWAAVIAQGPVLLYDSGTYHLSALRWAATYPVTPGLGNLNPALGLGSSLFLYLDAVTVADIPGFRIALGLLLVAILVELVAAARRRPASLGSRVSALLIMPALVFAGDAGFATTMYDVGSFAFCVAIALRLMRLLETRALDRRLALESVFVVATLGFAAITVKISNAPFSAACLALTLGLIARKSDIGRGQALNIAAMLVGLGVVLLLPWLVRNAVLTGYPLYPLPMLALPLDWTMPEATVRTYRDTLSDFARVRGADFTGASASMGWIGGWIVGSWRDGALPLLIAIVTPLTLLLWARPLTRRLGERWLILVPLWIGVVAWFVSAPDPRYASALLWLAAAVPLAFWLTVTSRRTTLLVSLLFVAIVEMPNALFFVELVEIPVGVVTGRFETELPQVQLTTWTTRSGLRVYGPPPGTDQVWDAPLPASFWRPDDALRLRCPDTLACGFTVR